MRNLLFLLLCFFGLQNSSAQEIKLSPFYKIGYSSEQISQLSQAIQSDLKSKNFEIVGNYHPEGSSKLEVICFTRTDLQELCLKSKDRGALASVLKIGLIAKENQTEISMLNPEYMFCAYLSNYESDKPALLAIGKEAKEALQNYGDDAESFGGAIKKNALKKYHYKIMMPYFDDPVELNEYESFEEGLKTIRKNLEAKTGNTELVYEQVYEDQKIAVFGIALLDEEDGEKHFLPIIGEEHIAAMPYEIILQGKEATMLHGKFRFALYWPELSMGTFMKIMSTPGDVEDFMEALTK